MQILVCWPPPPEQILDPPLCRSIIWNCCNSWTLDSNYVNKREEICFWQKCWQIIDWCTTLLGWCSPLVNPGTANGLDKRSTVSNSNNNFHQKKTVRYQVLLCNRPQHPGNSWTTTLCNSNNCLATTRSCLHSWVSTWLQWFDGILSRYM